MKAVARAVGVAGAKELVVEGDQGGVVVCRRGNLTTDRLYGEVRGALVVVLGGAHEEISRIGDKGVQVERSGKDRLARLEVPCQLTQVASLYQLVQPFKRLFHSVQALFRLWLKIFI